MMARLSHLLQKGKNVFRGSAKRLIRFFIADKRRIALVLIFGTIFSIIGIWYFSQVRSARAAWFNDEWSYRKRIYISSGTELNDFQVGFTLNTSSLISAGKLLSSCADLRVVAEDGRKLPFWVEENNPGCNNASTLIWTRVPNIPTTGMNIYVYYGNPTATDVQSGFNVFPFFDNFNGRALRKNLWSTTTEPNIFTGITAITIPRGAIYTNNPVTSTAQGYMYEQRTKWTTNVGSYAGMEIVDDQSTAGSNGESDSLIYLMQSDVVDYQMQAYAATGSSASYDIGYSNVYVASADTYHVSGFSMDSTNIRFYNNRSVSSTMTGTWTAAPYLYLGAFSGSAAGGADIKDMTTDWVLVRKFATTAPTIDYSAAEEVGNPPVSFWKFDEIGGTVTRDSFTGAIGLLSSGPVWQTKDMCISGGCLMFDGTNDGVDTKKDYSFASTDSFSISAWVNLETNSTAAMVLGKGAYGTSTQYEWSMKISNLVPNFTYWTTGGVAAINITSSQSIQSGKWNHIEVVYSSGTAYLYINGNKVQTQTGISGTFQNRTNNVFIGRAGFTTAAAGNFRGMIDEVKIYVYARTAQQVKNDFLATSAAEGSNVVLGAIENQRLNDQLDAYYKFDEVGWTGTAGEVKDSSGNNYNGTAALGANVTPPGKFGNAGYFNGTNYVTVGTAPDYTTGDFSISSWIKLADTTPGNPLMGKGFGAQGPGYGLRLSTAGDNAINFWLGNGSGVAELSARLDGTTPYLTANAWYHVVAVRKDGQMYIYLNGRKGTQSTEFTGSVSTTNPMYIGGRAGVQGNNYIDELRLYNRALSDVEVRTLYEFAPDPVIYFPFNENTGTVKVDNMSGNMFSGTMTGTMVAKNWVPGVYGSALLFDGTNDYVRANIGATYVNKRQGTMEMWFTLKSRLTTYQSFMMIGNTAEVDDFEFYQSSGGALRFGIDESAGGSVYLQGPPTQLNTLYHLAGVWKPDGTYYFYVNGILAAQGSGYPIISSTMNLFTIGADKAGANATGAIIDDVRVYNYARTPGQILDDFNAGTPAVDRPVGYWKMDEGYGTVLNNSSSIGSSLNATFLSGNSAPTWTNDGKFGKAITLDGSAGANIPANSALNTASEITMSAWIKPVSSASEPILEYNNGSNFGVQLWQYYTYDQLFANVVGVGPVYHSVFSKPNVITQNTWQYIAMTYDGNTARIYVNGNIVADTGVGSFTLLTSYALNIGNRPSTGISFNGSIDEVKVFAEALSPDEIKADYNRGKSIILGSSSQTSTGTGDNSSSLSYCPPGDTNTCGAPIAEWKMDEAVGNTLYDTAGVGYTGILSNGPVRKPGLIGGGVFFDGTNDYVNTATAICPVNMTFSMFVKPAAYDTVDYQELIRLEGVNGYRWSYYPPSQAWDIGFANSAGSNTNLGIGISTLSLNEWHHIAATVDGSTMKAYIDGKMITSTAFSGSRTTSCPTNKTWLAAYGTTSASARYYRGMIDQVRLYDYARTNAEIAWEYNKGAPAAWYKMDECEGTNIYNSAPVIGDTVPGNIGTLSIGSSEVSTVGTCKTSGAWADGASGKRNASMSFDGTDDYISIPDNSNIDFGATSDFAVAFWTKPSTNRANAAIVEKWSGTGGYPYVFRIGSNQTGILFARYDLTNNPSVNLLNENIIGAWHHIVGVKSGSTMYLYIDGILKGTTTDTTTADTSNSSDLYIGQRGPANWRFRGQVDDLRIYPYALTPQQIQIIMNNGAVRFE